MTSPADTIDARRQRWDDVWLLFVCTWSVAVLFHLAGNSRLAPGWAKAVVGIAALWVLARPRTRLPVAVLGAGVLGITWLEAPLLSNHLLLHAFVAAVVLGGMAVPGRTIPELMRRVHAPLRLTLLAFYGFAALAKLNADFFDPAVSCGVQFLQEAAASWNASDLVDDWSSAVQRGVAVMVATVELAVPILLAVRRTRQGGVLLALGFHFVLALNRDHRFFDFSSVLVALFLLFLSPEVASRSVDGMRSVRSALADRWSSGPELVRLLALAVGAVLVVIVTGSRPWNTDWFLLRAGVWTWFAYGIVTFALAAWAVRQTAITSGPLLTPGFRPLLLLLPAIAVLNGLAPYLELKTATSWNMYSNLRIVDGESNHLLARRGLPVTRAQERLVQVVSATGVDLSFYIGSDWFLPEPTLLDAIADRSGAEVSGWVDGQPAMYRGGIEPARPIWRQKLQVFRSVDGRGPSSCQVVFGPAR